MRGSKIWMATGNRHKYGEAKEVLSEYGIDLEHMPVERVEIQSDDLSEIAVHSLRLLPDDGRPIMIEDAGLFIDSYGGFPGPYSEYALRKLDLIGILKLMEGLEDRGASYRSAVAFKHEGEIQHFYGEVKGRIPNDMRGTHGFGYDPIFIPDEGDGRTFGEMTEEEKNVMSHRARAFRNLGRWLIESP